MHHCHCVNLNWCCMQEDRLQMFDAWNMLQNEQAEFGCRTLGLLFICVGLLQAYLSIQQLVQPFSSKLLSQLQGEAVVHVHYLGHTCLQEIALVMQLLSFAYDCASHHHTTCMVRNILFHVKLPFSLLLAFGINVKMAITRHGNEFIHFGHKLINRYF